MLNKKPRAFYGYTIIIASFFVLMLTFGIFMTFGVFFKPLQAEFGWSSAQTSGLFSLSMIVSGVMSIVMGRLNDRFGPRIVISISGFLIGLGYLLMSQVSALWQLYLFAIVFGFGYGSISAGIFPLAAEYFGLSSHGVILGFLLFGGESGNAVGSVLAGYIYDMTSSYTASFLTLAIISCIGIVLALRLRPAVFGKP